MCRQRRASLYSPRAKFHSTLESVIDKPFVRHFVVWMAFFYSSRPPARGRWRLLPPTSAYSC